MTQSKQFTVEFYHNNARGKISGMVGQALRGAASETAVLQYLQSKYPKQSITIINLEFK